MDWERLFQLEGDGLLPAWFEPLTEALADLIREAVPLADPAISAAQLREAALGYFAGFEKEEVSRLRNRLLEALKWQERALLGLSEHLSRVGVEEAQRVKVMGALLALFEGVRELASAASEVLGLPGPEAKDSAGLGELLERLQLRIVRHGVFPVPYLRLYYEDLSKVNLDDVKGDLFAVRRVQRLLEDPTARAQINLKGLNLAEQKFLDELLWIYYQLNPQMDGAPVVFTTRWAYSNLGLGPSERRSFRRLFFALGRKTFTIVIRNDRGDWLVAERQLYVPMAQGDRRGAQVLGFRMDKLILSATRYRKFYPIYPRLRQALPPGKRLSVLDYSLVRWLHLSESDEIKVSPKALFLTLGGSSSTWERNRAQAWSSLTKALNLAEKAGYIREWELADGNLLIRKNPSLFA